MSNGGTVHFSSPMHTYRLYSNIAFITLYFDLVSAKLDSLKIPGIEFLALD